MGKSMWFLLFLCAHATTSRACSSHHGSGEDITPPKIPISEDYFDYATENGTDTAELDVKAGGKVIKSNLKVTHGDFPHQVSLQDTNKQNKHFCGASIIHPKFLLSAAHCFGGANVVPHIRAVAGEHDLFESDGNKEQIRNVIRLTIHEYFDNDTYDNDIALLELNERLHFDNRYVSPITIRDSALSLPEMATVSGWGHVDALGRSPRRLQAAEIRRRDHQSCKKKFTQDPVTSNMICYGGDRDACRGDSGGPLTCSKNLTNGRQQPYLCGIVSHGVHCDKPDNKFYPGIYTDVSKYDQWIEKQLPPVSVYFGAKGGDGISAYLKKGGTNRRLIRSVKDPEGLTFNWVTGKFYYAEAHRIYSADENGKNAIKLFESKLYGPIQGLAFDWITGNLYGVSRYGFVFVCKIQGNEQLSCTYLLYEQGNLLGIALDPNNGQMYWTCWPDKIMRAQMDGTDVVQVLSGRDHPVGITIDYDESRLFWTEYGAHSVYSSALDGTDISLVANIETNYGHLPLRYPWGIALRDDYVYWGNFRGRSLQRCSKRRRVIETLLTDQGRIQHLTTSSWNFPIIRRNTCADQSCAGICVLTTSSYRCVPCFSPCTSD